MWDFGPKIHQMVMRFSGASHRASSPVTPKAS